METDLQGMQNPNFEKTLHELSVGNLNMKLTNEKLFINSLGSSETFALRSISGIGVADLVEKYNIEIELAKKNRAKKFLMALIGGMFCSFYFLELLTNSIQISMIASILVGAVLGYFAMEKISLPKLKSVVRIMISGSSRDFEFDKSAPQAGEIGRFVALIEDTLTSYQRN